MKLKIEVFLFYWNYISYMEKGLVKRGLGFTLRRKKWIILLGLVGFSGYGAYKVYSMPSLARKRKRILKLFGSLISMAEMVSDSAETITLVSRDLKEFLNSDSDEIPNSLKQLSKIARSEEFSDSVICVSRAMTVGISRGYNVENHGTEVKDVRNSSYPDRIMDKLMSGDGTGFVSSIVGSFARNLVMGFYASEGLSEYGHSGASVQSSSSTLPRWANVVSDDKFRVLLGDCIKTFVSIAVAVYLDKTSDVNVYDDMFSGMTNPKHQDKVTDILVSLCNGAVETLVKTSHEVMTTSKSDSRSVINQSEAASILENNNYRGPKTHPREVDEINDAIDLQKSGWINSMSSTLAVPSNRKFVLDVTGRVTFETVRSVIQFVLWKMINGFRTSVDVVHDEVLDRGFEVVRYVGAKSSVILTICIALFLHIFGNAQALMPA